MDTGTDCSLISYYISLLLQINLSLHIPSQLITSQVNGKSWICLMTMWIHLTTSMIRLTTIKKACKIGHNSLSNRLTGNSVVVSCKLRSVCMCFLYKLLLVTAKVVQMLSKDGGSRYDHIHILLDIYIWHYTYKILLTRPKDITSHITMWSYIFKKKLQQSKASGKVRNG